jgi:hypothetical protein
MALADTTTDTVVAWIIGANTMDDGSLDAIADFKKMDKQKSRV